MHQKLLFLVFQIISFYFLSLAISSSTLRESSTTFFQAKPGCQLKCGNVTIPYPFGIGDGCFIDRDAIGQKSGYNMRCNTSYDPPKLLVGNSGDIEILSISETELRMNFGTMITNKCYNESGHRVPGLIWTFDVLTTAFTFSYTKNRFFGIGCEITATLIGMSGDNKTATTTNSCVSKCSSSIKNMFQGACTGQNNLLLPSDLLLDGGIRKNTTIIPVVLDWAIGDMTCEQAQVNPKTYACQNNSRCTETVNNPGYRCACTKGYAGNPYLKPGCQDINECEDEFSNPCKGICTNTDGNYSCSCPAGSHGDGRKDGTGCASNFPVIKAALGIGFGLLFLAICASFSYVVLKKQKLLKVKEGFFQKNGGLLLRNHLSSQERGIETTKIFTAEEEGSVQFTREL
ncbi:wall-associated receptor kinase 2-like [Papaver somniferum]|uniref:wall-associated receptor kinase 2-like n=1 Tax=Papaver somniferum TaxID=3469 RepID=UPI000E6FF564|nr:wall-associated receptor kinase 2-like [Papaver somniferum]